MTSDINQEGAVEDDPMGPKAGSAEAEPDPDEVAGYEAGLVWVRTASANQRERVVSLWENLWSGRDAYWAQDLYFAVFPWLSPDNVSREDVQEFAIQVLGWAQPSDEYMQGFLKAVDGGGPK